MTVRDRTYALGWVRKNAQLTDLPTEANTIGVGSGAEPSVQHSAGEKTVPAILHDRGTRLPVIAHNDCARGSRPVKIDALTADMVDDVAALVAREHQHARDKGVPLPSLYLDAAACGAALRGLLTEGFSGFRARQGAQTIGVMCGRTFDGVGFVPAHGVAVNPNFDASNVMAEVFAELASVLVADGAVRVTVDHVDHESLAMALFDLGFGRGGVFAVRGTEPLDVDPAIEIHVGTAADLDSIAALSHVEYLYRSAPPMYALDQTRSIDETRAAHELLLDNGAIHLLARRADCDVGLLTIEHTSPAPRLCAADSPYIGPVCSAARSSGHSLTDLRNPRTSTAAGRPRPRARSALRRAITRSRLRSRLVLTTARSSLLEPGRPPPRVRPFCPRRSPARSTVRR